MVVDGKKKTNEVHSSLLSSPSHTTKYFHSTLQRLSIIHIRFTFLVKYEQSHSITLWGTQTDWRSADYSIY